LALMPVVTSGAGQESSPDCTLRAQAILRVALAPGSAASLKPAAEIRGVLRRPVYDANCQVLPEGIPVRAVIDHVERRQEKLLPFGWMKLAAGKRREPPTVVLRTVLLEPRGEAAVPLKASFLRLETERHLEARNPRLKATRTRMLLLRVDEPLASPHPMPVPDKAVSGTLAAGTRVRVELSDFVSSSSNRAGDIIQARIVEPLIVDGRTVVPAGAVLDGVITRSRRAPRMYRSGRLRLSFQSLRLDPGAVVDAPAALSAGNFASTANLDPEGGLTGGALDRKHALLNAGIAYLTGKILDDVFEESAKAVMGAVVAGSAATAARYVGLTSGALVFLLHRGRDVSLGAYTELELTFSREVHIPSRPPQ
jgi:hypothetical protein